MTLEELYTRPAFNTLSLASIPLSSAGKGLDQYLDKLTTSRQPMVQAFAFYFLDHCVALIKQKYQHGRLPDDLAQVVELYHALTTRFGSDMYAYLLLICNREFRYCKSSSTDFANLMGATASVKVGVDVKSSGGSQEAYKTLVNYKGKATLGGYCEVMTKGYYKLSWSSMYGGKKWGDIAKVLENYVLGKIPLMTLLDQSFSLQHNTSAIFNKGTVYEKESNNLNVLLDAQHAGQVIALAHDIMFENFDPLGVEACKGFKEYRTALEQTLIVMARHFEGLDAHVDWDSIIAGNPATSTQTLAMYKNKWATKFGVTQEAPVKVTAIDPAVTYYEITPEEKYQVVVRKQK